MATKRQIQDALESMMIENDIKNKTINCFTQLLKFLTKPVDDEQIPCVIFNLSSHEQTNFLVLSLDNPFLMAMGNTKEKAIKKLAHKLKSFYNDKVLPVLENIEIPDYLPEEFNIGDDD